mmetsp:Transcript_23585/g.48968  ORF Transcript_23585/g.48968 Transcript_23585/m.48968 type:complete len:246 (+) Transcript_23585:415-1152(+)
MIPNLIVDLPWIPSIAALPRLLPPKLFYQTIFPFPCPPLPVTIPLRPHSRYTSCMPSWMKCWTCKMPPFPKTSPPANLLDPAMPVTVGTVSVLERVRPRPRRPWPIQAPSRSMFPCKLKSRRVITKWSAVRQKLGKPSNPMRPKSCRVCIVKKPWPSWLIANTSCVRIVVPFPPCPKMMWPRHPSNKALDWDWVCKDKRTGPEVMDRGEQPAAYFVAEAAVGAQNVCQEGGKDKSIFTRITLYSS